MNKKIVIIGIIALMVLGGGYSMFASGAIYQYTNPSDMSKIELAVWPPKLGHGYPDLELIDQDGEKFKLSDFKGKVILVEPIGMTCAACQGFSGGNTKGAFQGNAVQKNLFDFRKMLFKYAGKIKLPHPDIIVVQILLYDMGLGAPKPKHANIWAEHFGLYKENSEIVAVSPYDMRSTESYKLIPGFQLIDKDFILRADSAGYTPPDDLYKKLLPMIPKLLEER